MERYLGKSAASLVLWVHLCSVCRPWKGGYRDQRGLYGGVCKSFYLNWCPSTKTATLPSPIDPLTPLLLWPTCLQYGVGATELRKSRGVITTSFSVNGADVGLASLKPNNGLKGVRTQWVFLLCRRCLSIAACSAGMLSRWHRDGDRGWDRNRPFKVPQAEKHQWVTCVEESAWIASVVSLGISVWRCHLAAD